MSDTLPSAPVASAATAPATPAPPASTPAPAPLPQADPNYTHPSSVLVLKDFVYKSHTDGELKSAAAGTVVTDLLDSSVPSLLMSGVITYPELVPAEEAPPAEPTPPAAPPAAS